MFNFKKLLSLGISAMMLFGVVILSVGCNDDPPSGERPKGTQVVVYMSGDYVAGSDEDRVKEVIEQKFWEDTGLSIDLDFRLKTTSDFNQSMTNAMASASWDAAVSYLGHAGIDEVLIRENAAMDITALINEYGENIKKVIDDDAFNALRSLEDKLYGIPSLNIKKQHGLLVRKDWMERVGFTDRPGDPDGLTTLRTIDQFESMLKKFRDEIEGCTIPLIGYPWDLERVITVGPTAPSGYSYNVVMKDASGNVSEVISGKLHPSYKKTLTYAANWVKDKLWEKDNTTRPISNRETAFISGQSGVYTVNPRVTEMIRMARLVKQQDPQATFAMLDPLIGYDDDGNEINGGFAELNRVFSALVINPKSANAELIVKYMDWMYSDVDNYELCTYGIKGEHWLDAGEGRMKYPEGKEEEYIMATPYSGAYAMLECEEFSLRLLDTYTEEEMEWINKAGTVPTYVNQLENILFPRADAQMSLDLQTAENRFFKNVMALAWSGDLNAVRAFETEAEIYREKAEEYLTWRTNQYKLFMAARS